VIEKCKEDEQIKDDGFSFTGLADIEKLVQNCTIDIIGVILEVGVTSALNLKDGTTRDKRTLSIGDESKISIGVTLWGHCCEAYKYEVGQVIALKACRVSEYNGKSLNASSDPNDILFNVKHPRALELAKWGKGNKIDKLKTEMKSLTHSGQGGSSSLTLMIQEIASFASSTQD